MTEDLTTSLRRYAADTARVCRVWFGDDVSRIEDPYRVIDPDQYTAGNLALLFSSLYAVEGDPRDLAAATVAMDKAVTAISDDGVYRLHRWFMYFHAALSYRHLRELVDHDKRERWRRALAASDIPEPHKTNIVGLAVGALVFSYLYGITDDLDTDRVYAWLDIVMKQQGPEGFINDQLTLDGMPVAYHLFTAGVLALTAAAIRRSGRGDTGDLLERLDSIVVPATQWALRFCDDDGVVAMAERSQHQLFTSGSFQICLAYLADPHTRLLARRGLAMALTFQDPSGETSLVPNHFPAAARCGYEQYSTVSVYNSLNAAAAMEAALIWEDPDARKDAGATVPATQGLFVDAWAGYGVWRRPEGLVAFSLRSHAYRYLPALAIYHLRLAGMARSPIAFSRLDSPGDVAALPPGTWREGDGDGPAPYWWEDNDGGPLEGVTMETDEGILVCLWKDNAEVTLDGDTLVLKGERAEFSVTRRLRWLGSALRVTSAVTPRFPARSVSVRLPIVTSDGRNHMGWELEGGLFRHHLAGEACEFRSERGEWDVGTRVSLRSPSGTSVQARLSFAPVTVGAAHTFAVRIGPVESEPT